MGWGGVVSQLKIIDLIIVNLVFWMMLFLPFVSIVDRRRKSLEQANKCAQRGHQGVRLLITMYLLLLLASLIFLALPSMAGQQLATVLLMALTGILVIWVLTLRSRDYEN